MMDLTLSVVSHGHGPLLLRLLTQLDTQPLLAGVRVVVTLNAADELFDATAYPALDIDVVRNATPKGFGANHNAAFGRCNTAWFGILNPDLALAGEEPFSRLLHIAQQAPKVGAIAPRVIRPDGKVEDSVRGNLTPWSLIQRAFVRRREAHCAAAPARRGTPFYWLAGMCLLVDAKAFRQLGGFDERFFLYCEDYDLCARLYNAGFSLVSEPSTAIVHDAQRDSHRSWRHLRWHLSSLAKVWLSAAFWRVTLR